jgi:hypothetical protein
VQPANPAPKAGLSAAPPPAPEAAARRRERDFRILFSYKKTGKAALLSHLSVIEVFASAMLRAGIDVMWSEGFNPAPKLDFAAPLSVGVEGLAEIAIADTNGPACAEEFARRLNPRLPEGFFLNEAYSFQVPAGVKKYAVPALLWGFVYTDTGGQTEERVPARDDKAYRASRFPEGGGFGLVRKAVLARPPAGPPPEPVSYFDLYRKLYAPRD